MIKICLPAGGRIEINMMKGETIMKFTAPEIERVVLVSETIMDGNTFMQSDPNGSSDL